MIDLAQMEGFNWDEGNSHKNVEKHGVENAECEQVFFNSPLIVLDDIRHSETEPRFWALGRTDGGRLLQVAFTTRQDDKLVRIISARPMNKKERAIYEKA